MYAAIRVRGLPDRSRKIENTLKHMGLNQRNSLVFLPETETFEGMLDKTKDIVTYGAVSQEFLEEFLEDRIDIESVYESIGEDSFEDLVDKIDEGEISLSEAVGEGFVNTFDMNSPKKGFKNTKRQFKQSGSLGFRENHRIEKLIRRM